MIGIVDREVLLRFLVAFARYEYALKISDFARPPKKPCFEFEARADRTAFAKALPPNLASHFAGDVGTAYERLLMVAPHRLMIVQGQAVWKQVSPPTSGDSRVDLLTNIHRLRNNLFHGNDASGVHGYLPAQLEQLLRDSVVVLETCIALVPRVAKAYDNATL